MRANPTRAFMVKTFTTKRLTGVDMSHPTLILYYRLSLMQYGDINSVLAIDVDLAAFAP